MAILEHLYILKRGEKAWNQWRQEHRDIWPDLRGADLRGLNRPKGYEFAMSDYSRVTRSSSDDHPKGNFVAIHIECGFSTDHIDGYLHEGRFIGTDINLSRVDLNSADLSGAHLWEADLSGTNLSGADLSSADLRDAYLIGAILHDANLVGANLRGAKFWEADLSGANLSGANLRGADLSNLTLNGTDLSGANLRGADLSGATLNRANLSRADLRDANLSRADLRGAILREASLCEDNSSGVALRAANLTDVTLSGADLSKTNLSGRDLSRKDLSKTNLSGAQLVRVNLTEANLMEANLQGAMLNGALLINTNLQGVDLSGCSIHGISVWNVQLEGATQLSLVITSAHEPLITIDNLEVAQFIYLLLNNPKIRDVIDTIAKKAVLILGRFTSERKAILDALRETLRIRGYLPILFDFEKPSSQDLTETVMTLAHLSRFIIADLTDPSCIPYELHAVVPNRMVPVLPLIKESIDPITGKPIREFAMFRDLRQKYHWVLPTYRYQDLADLLASLEAKVIKPAEQKAEELEKR